MENGDMSFVFWLHNLNWTDYGGGIGGFKLNWYIDSHLDFLVFSLAITRLPQGKVAGVARWLGK